MINSPLFRLMFQKSSCHRSLVQVETPLICPFVGLVGEKVIENVTEPPSGTNSGTQEKSSGDEAGMSKAGE
jgi:hypothetical protein